MDNTKKLVSFIDLSTEGARKIIRDNQKLVLSRDFHNHIKKIWESLEVMVRSQT